MTSTPEKHDADQAGGSKEVIFSSDGADPVPAAIKFPLGKSQDEDYIESADMTAEQAFEVFAGKLFVPNPYKSKKDIDEETTTKESPLQRLCRLKREIDELEKDCATAPDDEKSLFADQLSQLQTHIQKISTAQMQKHNILSDSITKSLSSLKKEEDNKETTTTTTEKSLSVIIPPELEQRLKRLEKVTGGVGGGSSTNGTTIVERIAKLESLNLDEKKLEQLQKRSKVIRQDLEAAAKARSKLMSSSGTGAANVEDSKTISTLYDQLQQIHGMTDHIPVLAQRLQNLAYQHTDAASRGKRLHNIEQIALNLQEQIQSIETSMTTLNTSIQQNATSMQDNIQLLEDKIKSL